MKKLLSLSLVLILALALLAGCGSQEPAATEEPADEVASASVVSDEATLLHSISKDGSWIPYLVNDVTTDKELVLEGEFHKKDDPSQDLYRKVALYAQDEDRNITERYTLTAPKLTVKSPNTTIQGGTFVGDVYVEANGFNLSKETKIEGNLYFSNEEYMESFTNDDGTITGATEVAGGVDAVSTPSVVSDEASLINAFSKDGAWLPYLINDVTTEQELVLEGDFHNKDDSSQDLYRKIALYAQDSDRNVTAEYTLTAPKLTVKSPNTKIQHGTFVGDIYVEAKGFNLADADVEGNIYFSNEDVKSTFTMDDNSNVTGVTEVQ